MSIPKLDSDPVLKIRDRYLELSKAPRIENDKTILRELRQLLNFVYKESPWWKNRIINDFGPVAKSTTVETTLAKIPVMNRAQLQSWGQAAWVVPEAKKPHFNGKVAMFATSGSTGQPIQGIRKLPLYQIIQNALLLLEWDWFERKPDARIAEIRLHGTIHNNTPYHYPLTLVGAGIRAGRSSTENSLDELIAFLQEFGPDYVYVNGTTAKLLALKVAAENLELKFDQLWTVSDKVDRNYRELIEDVFGAEVVDRYSCEEVGTIALQCPAADHLHVIEPTVFVELVDSNNRAVKPGEIGRVLLTSLHSFALPFLRYDVGDFAMWDPNPCPIGITWRALQNVTGRVRDTVVDETGNLRLVSLSDAEWGTWRHLLDHHVVRFSDGILMFIKTTRDLTDAERGQLVSSLQSIFYTQDPVEIAPMPETQLLPSVKRREFTRLDRSMPAVSESTAIYQEIRESAEIQLSAHSKRRVAEANQPEKQDN